MESMALVLIALVAASGATAPSSCAPTEEMKHLAANMTPPLHLPSDEAWASWRAQGADTSRWHTVCADVNDDGVRDVCTILTGDKRRWVAGCFVARGGTAPRFESFADSEASHGSAVDPPYYALGVLRKGETMEWSGGIGEIRLKRDCVSFGGSESSMSVHCFNGSYFLEIELAD